MSQSLVNNLIHLVYSTKHREPSFLRSSKASMRTKLAYSSSGKARRSSLAVSKITFTPCFLCRRTTR